MYKNALSKWFATISVLIVSILTLNLTDIFSMPTNTVCTSTDTVPFWTLIVTASLAISGWIQVWISRDTSERQLRAYLTLKECRCQLKDTSYDIEIPIHNSGQTPASNVRHTIEVKILEYPLTSDLKITKEESSTSYIGPNEAITLSVYNEEISSAEINAIKEGTKALYVIGKILYKDVLGKDRHYEYRRIKRGPYQFENPRLNIYGEDLAN